MRRFGPDQNVVELRLILAADCPKLIANKTADMCDVVYPDLRPNESSARLRARMG
jgi:hypothetical protein